MTDLPLPGLSVPGRLGVTARFDGELTLDLAPYDATLHHGVVRASVVSYVVDAAAGINADHDPEMWTLTSDLSVRMRPITAPAPISGRCRILRRGRRSATGMVELVSADGEPFATGVAGFAYVPRREGDGPKPGMTAEQAPAMLSGLPPLDAPLREAAGIEVLDAAEGVVQLRVTPELRNPAGTLQGAMVALIAESAAEDLVGTRFESPVVVVDLDVRYLAQAQVGPVRSRSRLLGDDPGAPVEVQLIDTSNDRLTTLVYARAVAVP